jgi:hypothetical protein
MSTTDTNQFDRLVKLYDRLQDWIPIRDFEKISNDYFLGPRSKDEVADLRARRGKLKHMADEVIPALHFVKFAKLDGEVRFGFNSATPDCWIRKSEAEPTIGLEITVAQGRERHLLGDELNRKHVGRGFLGLADDSPRKVFDAKLSGSRTMYSTEYALKAVSAGIQVCLRRKNKPRYSGFILLIDAPLRALPAGRWNLIKDDLQLAARDLPFREIYVIGDHDSSPIGFRIK